MEPDVLQLVQVCSDYFAHQTIELEEGCTVKEFCTKNGLKTKAFNIFLNLEYLPEGMIDQPPHDVILMDKDNTPKLHVI